MTKQYSKYLPSKTKQISTSNSNLKAAAYQRHSARTGRQSPKIRRCPRIEHDLSLHSWTSSFQSSDYIEKQALMRFKFMNTDLAIASPPVLISPFAKRSLFALSVLSMFWIFTSMPKSTCDFSNKYHSLHYGVIAAPLDSKLFKPM